MSASASPYTPLAVEPAENPWTPTEAVPLHATATIIILLEVLLISDKSLLGVPEGYAAPSYSVFFATLAAPVLMLFLGGFFLAHGAAKFDLDRNLARIMLKPFGTSPRAIMLGLMVITAVFSMFMSNTATANLLIPIAVSLGHNVPVLVVTVAVMCSTSMALPVSTPPNAIVFATGRVTIGGRVAPAYEAGPHHQPRQGQQQQDQRTREFHHVPDSGCGASAGWRRLGPGKRAGRRQRRQQSFLRYS